MTKWPAFGRCKSRLAKDIGHKNALKIQKEMFSHTIEVAKFLEKKGLLEISLAIEGIGFKSSRRWTHQLGIKNFNLQGKGNLGERMKRQLLINFKRLYKNSKRMMILIGTDLPELCHLDILEAISKTNENDIVLGPSKDGGYWLIAFSKDMLANNLILPFVNIQWSNWNVLQKTIDNLSSQNIRIGYLKIKKDIDTLKDLE